MEIKWVVIGLLLIGVAMTVEVTNVIDDRAQIIYDECMKDQEVAQDDAWAEAICRERVRALGVKL
jgi:hypothetical protein